MNYCYDKNIKYYFFSKKRKLNELDLVNESYDKYKIITLDEKYYLGGDEKYNFVVKPNDDIRIYNENNDEDINELNTYQTYNQFFMIQSTTEDLVIIFDQEKFINDIRILIDEYKNNIYDCIEILLPYMGKNKYYDKDVIISIQNIISENFKEFNETLY